MSAPLRYLIALCSAVLLIALPIIAVNYRLGAIGWADPATADAAARWQQKENGIASIAVPQERDFKLLRLGDRIPEIDAAVLGSSTAMSITAADLSPLEVYNFATSSNTTGSLVTEAEYILERSQRLKVLLVSFDWALGYIYLTQSPPPISSISATTIIPVRDQFQDTMTLARVNGLIKTLGAWARSPDPVASMDQALGFQPATSYVCADGSMAKDFGTEYPHQCHGFRPDGSHTFWALHAFSEEAYHIALLRYQQRNSEYVQSVLSGRGRPNPIFLERLARVAATLRARGGGLIVLLPPLMPGLESALLQNPLTGAYVSRTKEVLAVWSHGNEVALIDAGQSERFGCSYGEFFDGHHNFGQCYTKIFATLRPLGDGSSVLRK